MKIYQIIFFLLVMSSLANMSAGSAYQTQEFPRALSSKELADIKKLLPNATDPSKLMVTGNADRKYNCLAWALSISDKKILGDKNTWDKETLDKEFKKYGYTPTTNASQIAVMGASYDEIGHVCVFNKQYKKWESKLGEWLRILHDLSDVEGGNGGHYGAVLYYYEKAKKDR